ncbi:MAG: hypothetical protein V4534_04810 [Myxococcota bacterium]
MKKITQKLLMALAVSIAAMPAMAIQTSTPTAFIPVPVSEDAPTRFFVGLDNANVFSGGKNGFQSDGKIGLMNLQLNLGLIYNVGMGLDVGFGLHGGAQSPYGMFFGDVGVSGSDRYGYMLGGDVMIRYVAMLSDVFFAGLQGQVGYNYSSAPGIPDSFYAAPSPFTKSINHFIPVVAGLVLGVGFENAIQLYLFPAIELGQTGNYTNSANHPVAAADLNTGLWKSAIGMQMPVGIVFPMGYSKVIVQVKPRIANFQNKDSWGLDLYTGASWDF